MEYYELTNTVYLLKDILYERSNEMIGNFINRALLFDDELKQRHKQNCYKNYVYNSFYPIECSKVYRAGRTYIFRIRSLDRDFILKMKLLLPKVQYEYMKIVAAEEKVFSPRYIAGLYTLTPALSTVNDRHWTIKDDIVLLQDRIQKNLEKKYYDYYGKEISIKRKFIQYIELCNHKPIALKYKKTTLIGNKFNIVINDDDASQKLALVALAAGLLEKNATNGMGFCMPIHA